MPSTRIRLWIAVVATLGLALMGCGGGGGGQSADKAAQAKGPIKIWYSNNADEVKWGKAVVAAWNQAHADQQVTAEEIPAGKSSEEVIGASITAGNTPCLIFNTAPAAVPQFQKQGGLVALDSFSDGASYIQERTGPRADQYKSPDGKFYFYPLFIAETGKQLVEGGQPQFNTPEGVSVGEFWKKLYTDRLAQREMYNGDAFADKKAAMAIVGPWAIAVYGDKVKWGAVPIPTSSGKDPAQIQTFSDEKSSAMYSSCQNRATAWEFLKFATSQENDGKLLEMTGQMPMRNDVPTAFPAYFKSHPEYLLFAEQAARTVEVPNVPNSVEIWQTFRDAYSDAVIFGKADVKDAFDQAAEKVKTLAAES